MTWFGPYSGDNGGPVWSPDGKRLAFTEHNDNAKSIGGPRNGAAVYVVNLNGKGLRRITPWSLHATVSDWAPDGQHVLLTSEPNGDARPGGNLYSVRPDGTELTPLTHYSPTYRVLPGSYSPDGKSIVFATNAGGTKGNAVTTIDVDGGNVHTLSPGTQFDGWPDWSARP